LVSANLNGSTLEQTRFVGCNLCHADLRKTDLTRAEFIGVTTDGALYYGKSPWDGTCRDEDWAARLPTFDGE
jgi:uncharacterized protein YjbI with pentapeptide repeats